MQLNLGKVKGEDGANVYVKYNSSPSDTGATDFCSVEQSYIGVLSSASKTKPAAGYTWTKFAGDNGANGTDGKNCYIKYNVSASISGATTTWTSGQNYMGVAVAMAEPANTEGYSWVKILGFSYVGEIKEFDYTGISTIVLPTANRFDTVAKINAHFGGIWES